MTFVFLRGGLQGSRLWETGGLSASSYEGDSSDSFMPTEKIQQETLRKLVNDQKHKYVYVPPLSTVFPSGRVVAVQYRGRPLLLMKFLERLPCSMSFCGGMPSSSIIHAIWSASSSPGRSGKPARLVIKVILTKVRTMESVNWKLIILRVRSYSIKRFGIFSAIH